MAEDKMGGRPCVSIWSSTLVGGELVSRRLTLQYGMTTPHAATPISKSLRLPTQTGIACYSFQKTVFQK